MDSKFLIIAIVFAALVAAALVFLFLRQRKEIKSTDHAPLTSNASGNASGNADGGPGAISSRQMQLQAYERLILLTDRIALPNLIARVNTPGLGARDMQSLLTHSIRQEFEHNITQQIYVSAEAWGVIRDYKEQNLMIVNQVASFLSEEATGTDLNRALLDLLVQNPKASLQNVVSEALSYEAEKLM